MPLFTQLFSYALAALFFLQTNTSFANDTLVDLAAGGLEFKHTDELRMEREDLYLSPKEVRVSYLFRNLTDHDVHATIAFPMPVIDVAGIQDRPHEFHPSKNDGDVFDFHVEIDGHPITPIFEAHAYLNDGEDITDILNKHKVILIEPGNIEDYEKKDAPELQASGAYGGDHPQWKVRAQYHWDQIFPARRDVRVTHHYKPVLGGSLYNNDAKIGSDKSYCQDTTFTKGVSKLPHSDGHGGFVSAVWLGYILKTGANWTGPIGKFHLEIDKGDMDLLSLCPLPGLNLERKGHAFVAEALDYLPTQDIDILLVKGICGKSPCQPRGKVGHGPSSE